MVESLEILQPVGARMCQGPALADEDEEPGRALSIQAVFQMLT